MERLEAADRTVRERGRHSLTEGVSFLPQSLPCQETTTRPPIPEKQPVPSLIGMSLLKAERTITAWGSYTYSIAQWPRIGHGGTVIDQSPRAGTKLVPQDTTISLAVGVSYHFTALLKVDGCLAVDVDLEQISPDLSKSSRTHLTEPFQLTLSRRTSMLGGYSAFRRSSLPMTGLAPVSFRRMEGTPSPLCPPERCHLPRRRGRPRRHRCQR